MLLDCLDELDLRLGEGIWLDDQVGCDPATPVDDPSRIGAVGLGLFFLTLLPVFFEARVGREGSLDRAADGCVSSRRRHLERVTSWYLEECLDESFTEGRLPND